MHLPHKPVPRYQRALARAGVHSALLEVEYEPRQPFFRDVPARFSFARLTLRRQPHRSDSIPDEIATVTFQRHLLSGLATLREASHPRFDYGPHPWSRFYAPMLTPAPVPLREFRKLYRMARAASALNRLLRNIGLLATHHASPDNGCLLATCMDALQSQGVHIEVFHHLKGQAWPERDVIAAPGRFDSGAAARFVTSPSCPLVSIPD